MEPATRDQAGGKVKGSEVGERTDLGNAGNNGHDVPARGCATARPPHGAKRGASSRGLKLDREKTGSMPATTAMTCRPEVAPQRARHTGASGGQVQRERRLREKTLGERRLQRPCRAGPGLRHSEPATRGQAGGKLKGTEVGERKNWGNAGNNGHDVPARGGATASPPPGAKRGASSQGVKLDREKTWVNAGNNGHDGPARGCATASPPHGPKRGPR